jgi:hypothetical protein
MGASESTVPVAEAEVKKEPSFEGKMLGWLI